MKKFIIITMVIAMLFALAVTNISAIPEEEAVYLGNSNADNYIDIKDVTLIQKYVAGYINDDEIDLVAADVNEDGEVTVEDARDIQQYIAEEGTYVIDPDLTVTTPTKVTTTTATSTTTTTAPATTKPNTADEEISLPMVPLV